MVMDSLKLDEEINNYWVQQGHAQHPSRLYLSLETRPFSEDESQDLQYAMVAALVQLRFPLDTIASDSEPSDDTMDAQPSQSQTLRNKNI